VSSKLHSVFYPEAAIVDTFFKLCAILTLFFNVYLALSLLALARMSNMYYHRLPPLGWDGPRATPTLLFVVVIAWTAILAIGCLYGLRQTKKP
jgi:hypothetical protein